METNDMAAYAVAMVEMVKQVRKEAQAKDFDMHRVPGKYFVLCDWYLNVVAMFDDTEHGYKEALAWMKEQKPEPENEPDQRMTDVQREQALDRMRVQYNPCGICGSYKFGCTFIDLPGVKYPVIICASCLEQHKKNLERVKS